MAHERRQYILRLLEQRGRIRAAALARELGVTDETIRTDLVALQHKGLLKRVHGGAEYTVPTTTTADDMRADVAMARLLAQQINAGTVIYADACPFARVLATILADKPCTFITPSPQLAIQLAPAALPHQILCTGGSLDKDTRLCYGEQAEQALLSIPVQLAVLRPAALTPTHAAYRHPLQAHWAKLAARQAAQIFIVVPSTTLSAQAEHAVELPAFTLITEDNIPPAFTDTPALTIPYISADMLSPADDFDF